MTLFVHRFMTLSVHRFLPAAALALAAAPAAGQMNKDLPDHEITLAVETELVSDEGVSAHLIDVTTDDGIVTLSGTVDNLLAEDRALGIARSIKGVRSIVDRIEVAPVQRSDARIESDIEEALVTDPAADAYEVGVAVEDGVAVLTGEVDSWAERRLAEEVARGVRGLRAVRNELAVDYDEQRSDYAIAQEIRGRLESSVWVDDVLIDVEVTDGEVALTGTVGSALERRRAYTDAWVAGVQSVDVSGLDVEWWARDEMRRESRYASPDDTVVRESVLEAFRHDPRVSPFDVQVTVNDGVVTLQGIVNNYEAKRAARADAKNTIGVIRVKNHVRVRPEGMPDAQLRDRVTQALARDPYVERYDLEVAAINGKVYLSGDVSTSFEAHQAAGVASHVKGVVDVESNIDYQHEWTWQPDWQIREDVKDQLFWSPFVDSDGIRVEVEDGVVTLTGTVDTWSEWYDAAENAYEGGAKDVRNRLDVVYG